jgi:mono/diheme cytochrome c family protein
MTTLKLWLAAALAVAAAFIAAGLVLAQQGDPQRGMQLFAENCTVCHGPDGRGRIGANLTRDFPAIDVDAFLRRSISDGIEGTRMPAWSQAIGGPLSEQDIDDLVAYVNELSGGSMPAAPAPTVAPVTVVAPPEVSGDASQGAIVFGQNCAVCHGPNGQGRVGATLAKQWPSIDPARYVQQTVESGIDGTVMPAWLDAHGGPLTQQDVDNVTAYVLALKPAAAATPAPAPDGGLSLTTSLAILGLLVVLGAAALVIYYRRAR